MGYIVYITPAHYYCGQEQGECHCLPSPHTCDSAHKGRQGQNEQTSFRYDRDSLLHHHPRHPNMPVRNAVVPPRCGTSRMLMCVHLACAPFVPGHPICMALARYQHGRLLDCIHQCSAVPLAWPWPALNWETPEQCLFAPCPCPLSTWELPRLCAFDSDQSSSMASAGNHTVDPLSPHPGNFGTRICICDAHLASGLPKPLGTHTLPRGPSYTRLILPGWER